MKIIMNKKEKIVKRLFCVVLLFLLNINVFATVVTDNDGAAFITKAEFDALRLSFQAQIDRYNQSIDSKIDGAISSYLAGISVEKTTTENTLLDYSGGVFSVVEDRFNGTDGAYAPSGLPWTLGNVGFDWSGEISFVQTNVQKQGTNTAHEFVSFIVDVNRTPSNFKERMVQTYDEINKEACWIGYCSTQQMVSGAVNEVNTHSGIVKHPKLAFGGSGWAGAITGSGTETDPYGCVAGFIIYNLDKNGRYGLFDPISSDRTPLSNKDLVFYHEAFKEANTKSGTTWAAHTAYLDTGVVDTSNTQQLDFKAKGVNFSRQITSKSNEILVVCNNDTKYEAYRFSDNDLISGWCTENEDRFKTGLSFPAKSHDSMLPSGSVQVSAIAIPQFYKDVNSSPLYVANGQIFKGYLTSSDTSQSYFKIRTVMRTSATPSGGTQVWQYDQKPYFGFMLATELDDWRQLYTDKYDVVLDMTKLKNLQKEGASSVYTNAAGNKLMLGAGLPVLRLEKNCKYILKFNITSSGLSGETSDYYLWLKDGTFTENKKPQNESNLFDIIGLSKDATGYILPVGTTKEITIEAKADGYLFCKWRNKNLTGGGNLKIDRNVTKIIGS